MRNAIIALLLAATTAAAAPAANGPDIRIIDNKVSIQADGIALARLLQLLDQATGMSSNVPPELANRTVSVRFSNLPFDDAVRRIFEGQPIDYVLIEGKGIHVTSVSQTLTAADRPPATFNPQPQPENNFGEDSNPFQMPPNPQQVIQTPFGPIPNPRAQQQNGNGAPQVMQQLPNGQVIPGTNQQPGTTITPDNGLFGVSNGAFGATSPGFNTNQNPVNIAPSNTPATAPSIFPSPVQPNQPARKP